MSTRRVAVAMSGGVDSSVAAALLAGRGEDVLGLMLRLWSPQGEAANRCCSPRAVSDARAVAHHLGIPFYVLDAQTPFLEQVVRFFIDGYAQGITPNPCLECNRHIRWGFLLQHALSLGATHLATGHYARLARQGDKYVLLRASDMEKDQSYVLSILHQHQLAHALFPIGELTKSEVRGLAARFELPVANRPDSQDLCFVASGDYRVFLRTHAKDALPPGPIVDPLGVVLGEHRGLHNYTIGQRKGIGLSSTEALYVLDKRTATKTLVVGPRHALGRRGFQVAHMNWVSGETPPLPRRAAVRVRYKAREVQAEIRAGASSHLEVEADEAIPDVTPGQAAVFYDGDVCLGGGLIQP
jgi:tRNA-specific 2-thiouridylase